MVVYTARVAVIAQSTNNKKKQIGNYRYRSGIIGKKMKLLANIFIFGGRFICHLGKVFIEVKQMHRACL